MQKFDKVLYLKNQFALTFFGLAEQEISLNKNIRGKCIIFSLLFIFALSYLCSVGAYDPSKTCKRNNAW